MIGTPEERFAKRRATNYRAPTYRGNPGKRSKEYIKCKKIAAKVQGYLERCLSNVPYGDRLFISRDIINDVLDMTTILLKTQKDFTCLKPESAPPSSPTSTAST